MSQDKVGSGWSIKEIKCPPKLKEVLIKAIEDPENFWGNIAGELYWLKKWDKVFEWKYPFFKWFVGGITNVSYNCLDRNVELLNRGDKPALIWESGELGESRVLTYKQLYEEVKKFAATLKALGVKKGDRVTIYMPMIPEAAIAMLACTRIGAIHSVVFAGFGHLALADRIMDAEPKLVLTADLGYRRGKKIKLKDTVDRALEVWSKSVEKVVVLKRGEEEPNMVSGRDIYWDEALEMGKGVDAEVEWMEANEPAFILYTSGTTAKPKGTVQTHGGYQVYIYSMAKWVYDMRESDIWWSLTDIGWIVGHSYVVYAPLLIGCATIMYEGTPDYPSPHILWEIIERRKVSKLWLSPTLIRALMRFGEEIPKQHDLSSVKLIFSAGEVLNPAAWDWLQNKVFEGKAPVIDHMWQTESSGPMVGNPCGIVMLPIKPGSAGIPLPGVDADVVDNEGKSMPPGVKGVFICKRPFPGLTPTLWRDPDRYAKTYWYKIPGYYYTGDAAMRDEDGYIWFIGRTDEVIKIAAHRIGTIEIENVLVSHPAVAEAAVVGRPDPLKGEVGCAFVTLKPNYSPSEELKKELRQLVREKLGPIVIISDIFFVSMLPKTRSGKIMRRLIKAIIRGEELGDYSTIEDEAAIEEIRKAVESLKK